MDTRRRDGTVVEKFVSIFARLLGLVAVVGIAWANPAFGISIFSNTHSYTDLASGGNIRIDVEVFDNYMGDFNKYLWQYTVHNIDYDPAPGSSNGFSGFELALPAAVPDIGDIVAPSPLWDIDSFSGQPVEWDLRNIFGLGVMPGQMDIFSFTTLPRFITNSTGWFHTWQNNVQTFIANYSDTPGEIGPEVPDVLRPAISAVPEPSTVVLMGLGLFGLGVVGRRKMLS